MFVLLRNQSFVRFHMGFTRFEVVELISGDGDLTRRIGHSYETHSGASH